VTYFFVKNDENADVVAVFMDRYAALRYIQDDAMDTDSLDRGWWVESYDAPDGGGQMKFGANHEVRLKIVAEYMEDV
jgi:hypothetical protein